MTACAPADIVVTATVERLAATSARATTTVRPFTRVNRLEDMDSSPARYFRREVLRRANRAIWTENREMWPRPHDGIGRTAQSGRGDESDQRPRDRDARRFVD